MFVVEFYDSSSVKLDQTESVCGLLKQMSSVYINIHVLL